jgi:BirA family biotin operon repressor/biotin-[acetyl-CoA-carboxylase] ligase
MTQAEWLPEVDSTNDLALARANQPGFQSPLLIGADSQTAGRGRGSNRWWGASGALMFSIVSDMSQLGLTQAAWPRFSLVTGLAISETLASFVSSMAVGLKWPNDVWLGRQKVCGILIEQSEQFPERLVIGVGLNVNNSFRDAPAENRAIATSMADATGGMTFSRTEVLLEFLSQWRRLTEQLASGQIDLVERWSRLCVLTGNPVVLTNGRNETTGVCAGIDSDGALLLRTAFSVERHYAGTVRLLG